MYDGYITDVGNIRLGHDQNQEGKTGVSVIIPDENNTAAVDVRGSAPGTRETDLLNPINQVSSVNAIILSGSSAYGLDAASGVMQGLEEDGLGFDVGVCKVPIVTQAVLFDLAFGDPYIRVDAKMGIKAYKNAKYEDKTQGAFGAGTGATVGKGLGMEYAQKSGLGQAMISYKDLKVGAIVALNAFGDIYDSEKNIQIAGPRIDGKMIKTIDNLDKIMGGFSDIKPANTTIATLVTNATFDKTALTKIAQMGHDGFARSINPVHTMFDGDTIFALATNKVKADINLVGILGAKVISRAIANAIYTSKK